MFSSDSTRTIAPLSSRARKSRNGLRRAQSHRTLKCRPRFATLRQIIGASCSPSPTISDTAKPYGQLRCLPMFGRCSRRSGALVGAPVERMGWPKRRLAATKADAGRTVPPVASIWHPAEDDLADTTPARRHELSGLFALAIRDGVARLLPVGRHTDTAEQNHIVTATVSHHTARHTVLPHLRSW
jgi:hypothetical protein